ncbi:sigma-70 family RNA polymerase sigma factor [Thermoactinospora rubra]|uniref:sigma-70 family RNA polymerase sigma factor n=1 Tax=Thermoactinospora rubra TaxID=1088767 RepID=UPI000A0F802B
MSDFLARRFEEHRPHLRAVAYRMLGSLAEAEDAVQEAWLRLSRTEAGQAGQIDNLGGWLTTVVGRVCLDMLRSRAARREDPIGDRQHEAGRVDPEHEAMLADSVGVALLVVLETLEPAERLAFVLHDLFGVPFEDIARIVDRTPAAARKLASRARARIRGVRAVPAAELPRQRAVVEAFLAAARGGDFEGLLTVLDPDVVVRSDTDVAGLVRGAAAVARQALTYATLSRTSQLALVDGMLGIVVTHEGRPVRTLVFTVRDDKITELRSVAGAERLAELEISLLID